VRKNSPSRSAAATEATIGFLINDVARLLRRHFDQRALALGLTRAQWSAMFHLARCEGINQRTLAGTLEIEPITLTRLIDRLEKKGWVERREDTNDRRAYLLHLTDRARPVMEELRALAAGTRQEALRGVSADEQARLARALTTIKTNLNAALGRPDDAKNGKHSDENDK
jgi:DNA-binding MarR family transcriptional regulator